MNLGAIGLHLHRAVASAHHHQIDDLHLLRDGTLSKEACFLSVRSGGVHGLPLMSVGNMGMTGGWSSMVRGVSPNPMVGCLYTSIFDESEKTTTR